jgi:hypothetical protein
MSELKTVAHYQRQAIEGLQLQVERLQEQLDAITGDRQKSMIVLSAGGVDFQVNYEFEEGEEAILDINSPVCGPGYPPSVTSMEVWINGGWMDAYEILSAKVLARWEDWIVEECQGTARARREEHLMEKADMARNERIEREWERK